MSATVYLVCDTCGMQSREDAGESRRHPSIGFDEAGGVFLPHLIEFFRAQQLHLAHGHKCYAASDDWETGHNHYPTAPLSDFLQRVSPTYTLLFADRPALGGCSHENPCHRPSRVVQTCPWSGEYVDSDLCRLCDYHTGLRSVGLHHEVTVVHCTHPEATDDYTRVEDP